MCYRARIIPHLLGDALAAKHDLILNALALPFEFGFAGVDHKLLRLLSIVRLRLRCDCSYYPEKSKNLHKFTDGYT